MDTPKKNFPSDPRPITGGYRGMRWMAYSGSLVLLLSCAIAASLQPSQSTTPGPTPGASASPSLPAPFKGARGVFIVTGHNVAIQTATYANPAVDGIVIRTFWSAVQPAADRFDWSFIDSQVQAAAASGRKVILLVLPGAFTPSWALEGVQSAPFVVDYGFAQGTTVTLPAPWDPTYL